MQLKICLLGMVFSVLFQSCGTLGDLLYSQEQKKLIGKVVHTQNIQDSFVKDTIAYGLIKDFLKTNIVINDSGSYDEFGPLRGFVRDSTLQEVFNNKNLLEIEELLKSPKRCCWSAVKNTLPKNLKIVGSFTYGKTNKQYGILNLSYPIIFSEGKYSLISYSYRKGYYDEQGTTIDFILKKEGNEWLILERIYR